MAQQNIYKVTFYNQNKVYEVYARQVYQADLYGFVAIEGLTFNEHTSVVIDPGEEKLKAEFEQVKRFFIPVHAVIRVDEVNKQGVAKISEAGGNVAHFPVPAYNPGNDRGEKS